MSRLLLVSNRLPVTARYDHDRIHVEASSGGLATGLRGPHERSGGLWIGWPGDSPNLDARRREELDQRLAELRTVPVHLKRRELRGFYEEISNGVLWPLFHYLLDELPANTRSWETYRAVNEKFARVVADQYRPGDLIWVHDYHLALLPAMLRRLLPDARIGFFLHIPFPSSEVFSVLPWREELLRGMLGADLIGFHAPSYLRHFATSMLRVLGFEVDVDRIRHEERDVRLGVFPMGIDAAAWASRAYDEEVERLAAEIRRDAEGKKIILGIDRLDYTKGIPRRMMAIERLFEMEPSLRGKLRYIQVTVPSRDNVNAYNRFRRRIDEMVGRINSTYATATSVPIHNIYRAHSETEVAALYRAADVMLVTPLRDGMNLVAKEFVASRVDEDGVLILSEFAGAAAELGDALHINPYDVDRMAGLIRRALTMPDGERRARMRRLRDHVMTHDVNLWAMTFIDTLEAVHEHDPVATGSRRPDARTLIDDIRAAGYLELVLDYDGTLVPFAETPDQAIPDREILTTLDALAHRPNTRVHVVSGRSRRSLERWLGALPLGLHAEHGLWSRLSPAHDWIRLREVSLDWKDKVRGIMEQFVESTPGSFIEEKSAGLAWHYRMVTADFVAQDDYGEHQAKELRLLLGELLSNAPVEVLVGNKVVEVRTQGVHKGAIAPLLLDDAPGDATIVAIGDDRTDEDLFAAMPSALTIKVGRGPSAARYGLPDVDAVRAFLRAILDQRPGERPRHAVTATN
ncbi:MAG TPA: bifunctional alpha,alpha-trehalose-phosphate synthase (UDP-forming)/trehalose-phosphatase [Dehalococcoidia bacterium]|nr:bifunctional alpha,alpha-trehalose-phosphate synthase (UDP-forming)/trehalose-phosphatase [Dehalococcoidia bacterium]